ncbi:MAG: hypothetical protein IJ275_03860 [Ruminococcus sp.]|nr:hypothetical protein [Ruminococcus sp.]
MKKLTCVILVIMMLFSIVSVSAIETENGNLLHFDVKSAGWTNYKKIFCHIWEYGGESFFAWQAKGEQCKDENGDGVWTYDLDARGVYLDSELLYVVIFSNENGDQTYNLLLHNSVIGGTAYCNGTFYENPADSSKLTQAAFWKNEDETLFGPEKCITSIGNVVGTCVPIVVTPLKMLEHFLINDLENARTYSGKEDQQLIDDIGKGLDLTITDVSEVIKNTGIYPDWTVVKSTLGHSHPSGEATPDNTLYLEQFRDYANLDEYDGEYYSYSGPLFYYYEKGKDEPSWFLARGNTGAAACAVIYGIFDDYYLINNHIEYPSDFNWHVYIYEEDKFYAIEDIWEDGFADKEIAFSQYLVPKGYADILGDADGDGELSVLDATQIQLRIAGLCESEDRIPAGHHFGDRVIYPSDIDHDGDVSIMDATHIQLKIAKIIPEL